MKGKENEREIGFFTILMCFNGSGLTKQRLRNELITHCVNKYIMVEMEHQNGQIKQTGVKLTANADTFEVTAGANTSGKSAASSHWMLRVSPTVSMNLQTQKKTTMENVSDTEPKLSRAKSFQNRTEENQLQWHLGWMGDVHLWLFAALLATAKTCWPVQS